MRAVPRPRSGSLVPTYFCCLAEEAPASSPARFAGSGPGADKVRATPADTLEQRVKAAGPARAARGRRLGRLPVLAVRDYRQWRGLSDAWIGQVEQFLMRGQVMPWGLPSGARLSDAYRPGMIVTWNPTVGLHACPVRCESSRARRERARVHAEEVADEVEERWRETGRERLVLSRPDARAHHE